MRIKRRTAAALKLLANPVAYAVLAAVGARGPQTTATLGRLLPDVPASSLYRQLAGLRKAGVLEVVAERQARGAVERTYALASHRAGAFTPAHLARMGVGQRRALLRNFLATLVADATAFIESRAFVRPRAPMNAVLVTRSLTDAQYTAVLGDLKATLERVGAAKGGSAGRKRRSFYLVTIPEVPAR